MQRLFYSLPITLSVSLYTDETYVVSKKAEAILSAVLADILEQSFQDAKNLAVIAGKSGVTREEIEKSLRNLCQRLNTMPTCDQRLDINGVEDNNDSVASSKVGRKKEDR